MKVGKKFYQLSKDEFSAYLSRLKESADTIWLLENTSKPYFYAFMRDTIVLLQNLNKEFDELHALIESFSDFGKRQILQTFFIEEIESTNAIESIYSTRHDIFSVMNQVKGVEDKKITSIIESYKNLLLSNKNKINSLSDLRDLYNQVMLESIEKEDYPDGQFFRKNEVYITDGLTHVHQGIVGEEKINLSMVEFLEIYNSNLGLMERMIISHFLFETIHPFYDGNGRFGRFLFSYGLYQETNSILSFKVANSFSNHRQKYYKSFKDVRSEKEFGCINGFVEDICNILMEEMEQTKKDILLKIEQVEQIQRPENLKKSETIIFDLLAESSFLSEFGLSNTEIKDETEFSKSTVDKTIKKFKEKGILISTRIGYFVHHKIKIEKSL